MQVTKEDLKVGMTIYRVYGLGGDSFIDKMKVISEPHVKTLNKEKVTFVKVFYEEYSFNEDISLMDSFIEPNTYNNHMTFDCESQAKRYLSHCKNGGTRAQWLEICDNVTKTWGRS